MAYIVEYKSWQLTIKKYYDTQFNAFIASLLVITALIASLIPRECKQAVIPSQELKQGI